MTVKWPTGKRFTFDETGVVEELPADHPVQFWVCCRLDEPWTWRVLPHQHVAPCVDCGAALIYRVSEKSPSDPAVQKVCRRCMVRLAASRPQ